MAEIRAFGASEWGVAQAVRYAAAIRERLKLLRRFPAAGVNVDDVIAGLRRTPVGSHAIYYVERDAFILVTRILHHRMDHMRHVSESD